MSRAIRTLYIPLKLFPGLTNFWIDGLSYYTGHALRTLISISYLHCLLRRETNRTFALKSDKNEKLVAQSFWSAAIHSFLLAGFVPDSCNYVWNVHGHVARLAWPIQKQIVSQIVQQILIRVALAFRTPPVAQSSNSGPTLYRNTCTRLGIHLLSSSYPLQQVT
jgi:hypothetical protein